MTNEKIIELATKLLISIYQNPNKFVSISDCKYDLLICVNAIIESENKLKNVQT